MNRFMIMACVVALMGGAVVGEPLAGGFIPVTDRAVMSGLSPYNWVCKEDYISSTVCGASLTLGFKKTRQVMLQVDMEHAKAATPRASRYPIIAWSVNGGAVQTHQLAAGEKTVLLSSGVANPVVDLYIKGMSPFEHRYQGDVPGIAVKINGFLVDKGGTAKPVSLPGKVWLNIGDSIMSGDGAAYAANQGRPRDDLWAESDDGRACYGYLLARHYGYREARLAYGGYNWSGGLAGIPRLVTLIDQKTSTVKRMEGESLSPSPEVVLVNLGENGVPADKDVIEALGKLRSRVGQNTKIILMIPVSGRGRAEITRAFGSYKAAAKDARAYLVDLGPISFATCDQQHPVAAGHQTIYKAALPAFTAIVK